MIPHRHGNHLLLRLRPVRVHLYHANGNFISVVIRPDPKIRKRHRRQADTPVKIFREPVGYRNLPPVFLREDLNAVLVYIRRLHHRRVVKQYKVCKLAGRNHSSVIQMHPSARCVCGAVDRHFSRKSGLYCLLYNIVKLPFLAEDIRHGIIRHKTAVFIELILADIFQHFRFQHLVLYLKEHAVFDPLLHLFQSMFRMIAVNPQI